MEMGAIIGYATLAIIGLALAVPNYFAVRYALLGGEIGAAPAGAAIGEVPAAKVSKVAKVSKMGEFGFMWKALSPIVFAFAFILGLGIGGPIGTGIVLLTLLNMILGFFGWGGYVAGYKK